MLMKRSLLFLSVVLLGYLTSVMAFVSSEETPKSGSQALEVSSGNVQFTRNLYDVLRKTPGNVFFSPLSLEIVLSLACAGAGGNTAAQIRQALSLPESEQSLLKAVRSILDIFQTDKVTLTTANGLFVHESYSLVPEYVENAQKHFLADVRDVNFGDPEAARGLINAFVEKHTNNKIQELFPSGSLDPLTRLVLVNAIYFKGNWASKFDPQLTHKADFHLNEKDKVEVDFMATTAKFKTAFNSELNATIVSLPYQGEEISMVLLVPDSVTGLEQLEERIQGLDLNKLASDTVKREVILKMPKFKLEQTLDLNVHLRELGLTDMFSQSAANFSGLTTANDLYVSQVIQKAFIDVNEEGSEAAAATGMVMMLMSLPPPPLEVTVNKPFIFYLRHNPTGRPLFFGRFSQFT